MDAMTVNLTNAQPGYHINFGGICIGWLWVSLSRKDWCVSTPENCMLAQVRSSNPTDAVIDYLRKFFPGLAR